MLKVVSTLFLVVLTSLFFFPFEFTFLPGFNTKMIMAGMGLVLFGINMASGGRGSLDKGVFLLSLLAIFVSIIGLVSVTLNGTSDFSYATYIISMWVWLGGAYFVAQMIKWRHGNVTIPLLCNYLIAVCVAQCIIAFAMSVYQPLKTLVDGFLGSRGFMGKVDARLYGIGASLDVAGMRFAAVLVMIACLCVRKNVLNSKLAVFMYVLASCIISVFGNMIGRSTVIGLAFAVVYVLYQAFSRKSEILVTNLKRMGITFALVAVCSVFVLTYFYNTNANVHDNLRFGFEGFFSLIEKGRWETHSNEILKNMYVFPDNIRTWIIGDGYLENPYDIDPYYIGPKWGGYYMATDVGYLRFIFYFGVTGMIAFSLYMFYAARILMERHPKYKVLFLLVLLVNYVMWFKVASDLFLVFAFFLCADRELDTENNVPHLSHSFHV